MAGYVIGPDVAWRLARENVAVAPGDELHVLG